MTYSRLNNQGDDPYWEAVDLHYWSVFALSRNNLLIFPYYQANG